MPELLIVDYAEDALIPFDPLAIPPTGRIPGSPILK
jgi:hypothetical protein